MTTISDLPGDLVVEILSRVPLRSLRATRSTCKKWDALSKNHILGKKAAAAARKQFVGFMMKDSRLCFLQFDLQGIHKHGDFVYPSIKQISKLNQVEISKVFHCDGLLLCVLKDNSRLLVWNPYLGQTRWIQPRKNFDLLDRYAIGYDKSRNHKILRIFGEHQIVFGYEIYDFSSNSWKVFDVKPDEWYIWSHQRGVSLKGNTFFSAKKKIPVGGGGGKIVDILLCFDFTTERFGPSLFLPFCSDDAKDNVTLSCVRDEHLAVLHQRLNICQILEIWVTNKIEPNAVSWNKFLRSLADFPVDTEGGSFFIDEEKKVAVVFDLDKWRWPMTSAHIIGGYYRRVNIGEARNIGKLDKFGYFWEKYSLPLLVSPGTWLADLCPDRYDVRVKKSSKKRRARGLKAMGNMETDSD